jgi:hypothetical protein
VKRLALLVAEGACTATHQIEDLRALSDCFDPMDERFADAFLFDQRSISLSISWGLMSASSISTVIGIALKRPPHHIDKRDAI